MHTLPHSKKEVNTHERIFLNIFSNFFHYFAEWMHIIPQDEKYVKFFYSPFLHLWFEKETALIKHRQLNFLDRNYKTSHYFYKFKPFFYKNIDFDYKI